jgi:hypothetical protein
MVAASKIRGSKKGPAVAPRPRKTLTKKDLNKPRGRFAAHLEALIKERGWDHLKFAKVSGFESATIRKWLRAEGFPNTADLEKLGRALDVPSHPFPDYRMILPPNLQR